MAEPYARDLPDAALALHRESRLHDFGIQTDHGAPMAAVVSSKLLKSEKSNPKTFSFVKDPAIQVELFEHNREECGYQSLGSGRGKLLVEGWDKDKFLGEDKLFGEIKAKDSQITVINTTCSHGAAGLYTSPHAYLHDSRRPRQLLKLREEFPEEGDGLKCSDGIFFGCAFEAELFFNRYLVV